MFGVSLKRGQDKLERFVSEYSERGYQFAYGLCGNAEDAKELVQEAFFRVFRSWDSFDQSQPLDTWFLTILRHVYVDSRKRYERRCGVSLDASADSGREDSCSLADVLADPRDEAMLDRLSRDAMAAEVRRAMDGLKADYKAVLNLCDVEGLSYEQICVVMDCPLGTVRSRINRARAALKQALLTDNKEVDLHGM
jgi:RNA polymerase sigma-70 factor (ECF subfamily)